MESLKQHLIGRGMNPDLYKVQYDSENGLITFYLYNSTGHLVGYQQYNPDQTFKKTNDAKTSRYFTYLPREVDGLFGLEQIDPSDRTIYIVEGVFKASMLHRLGFNAVAVLSATPKRLKPWFRIMRATWNLVAIGDPDPAGQKLVNMLRKGFTSPMDLDEMSDKDILELLGSDNPVSPQV